MKLSDLHDVIPVSSKDLPDVAITGVTADTRAISKGNIFIAVPGVKVNGAAFAAEAVEKGAVAVICGIDAEIDVLPVPVIRVEDPRRDLALLAAAIHTPQPETIVAVTGTAGKTSVAAFTRQIFEHAELKAASIGTTGVEAPGITIEGALTTPDPVKLHQILKQLSDGGVTHAAMEASSHGLDQRRLDGVRLAAAAFTNLGRDHMDYHPTIGDYLNAKMRLFDTLMDRGKPAVIFADDPYSGAAIDAAKTAGLDVRTVGRRGDYINLTRVEHEQHRQIAEIVHAGQTYRVELPLAGDFQIANALVSAGLAISCGVEPKIAFAALEHLKGAPGRLELVGKTANGAPVYVDYAHKPEALQQVLESVRPFTPGEVVVVFGCGGDRDPGKRPIMGGIAAQYSDRVYVTDDNPRSEDPALIRKAIMEAAPDAIEIGDRREAIFTAVKSLKKGDTLVIAGKGHETGQTAKGQTRHFSDHEEAREAIEVAAHVPEPVREPLWTGQAMIDAMGARPINGLPAEITGISIDSRTIEPGEAFFAIKGDQFDGHDFATKAAGKGASCLVVSEARIPALGRLTVPLMVVDDVMDAMCKLAGAARARTKAQIVAITGSAGKTTTKDALRHSLQGQGSVHAAAASFNNHWGVPLTLARMPADTDFGIFEIGMNHPGEITPLVKMVKPHLAIITLIAGAHLGHFKDLDEIAHAKAEIFSGVVDGGAVLLNRDDKRYKLLNDLAAKAGITNRYSFGENKQSDVKLTNGKFLDDCSCLSVKVFEDDLAVKISVPGRHIAQNVLAVLGAIKLTGGDIAVAGHALAKLTASDGRGRRYRLKGTGGEFILIDESYNANPASMEAALAMLAEAKPGPRGRRIAVLGDMLEMGEHSGKLHAALADPIARSDLSTIYLAGSEMGALDAKLPEALESHYFEEPSQLQNAFTDVPRGGDVIMIKSSNGLGFRRVVKTLLDTYGPPIED